MPSIQYKERNQINRYGLITDLYPVYIRFYLNRTLMVFKPSNYPEPLVAGVVAKLQAQSNLLQHIPMKTKHYVIKADAKLSGSFPGRRHFGFKGADPAITNSSR